MQANDKNIWKDDQVGHDHSPLLASSLINVPNSNQIAFHEDIIKFTNPKQPMKRFIADKVPEPIEKRASRSGAFADCLLSKFWECSLDNWGAIIMSQY